MCLAGVANGIFSVPSTLDLVGQPDAEDQPPGPIASTHGRRLRRQHQRVAGPGGDHRGADSIVLVSAPIVAMAVRASGTAELGEPVRREAVRLGLGGVLSQLPERSAPGDEAGAVESDAHRRIMPRMPRPT